MLTLKSNQVIYFKMTTPDDNANIAMHVIGTVSCATSLSVLVVYISCKEVNAKPYNSVIALCGESIHLVENKFLM